MKGTYYNPMNKLTNSNLYYQQQEQLSALKIRYALKEQKKQFQRRLYGEHYNYSKVGLNKEKKYLIEEQRNTQIQRSNRILLEKIQRIAKRSVPNIIKKRAITEDSYQQILSDQKQNFKQSRMVPIFKKSSLQETQANFHKLLYNDQRALVSPKKHIFKTTFKLNEKIIEAKAYIESNQYILSLQVGKMNQKLKLDLDNYKQFYANYLNRNHQNILDYLKYNGTIFELRTDLQQKISLQQQQYISLPFIQNKNENKLKYVQRSDSLLQSSLNF